MAFIDGGYTTSKNMMKDLANIFTSANKQLAPTITDEPHTVEDLKITLLHLPITGTSYIYKLDGSVITPTQTIDEETGIVSFTAGVEDGDEITVTYDGEQDWELIFPVQRDINDDDPEDPITLSTDEMKRNDQLARILVGNRFIIKTITTATNPDITSDPFGTDPGANIKTLNMYAEFTKPLYCINPETGQASSLTMTPAGWTSVGIKNNHYLLVRIIDEVNETTGVIVEGAKVSEWSKYSWFMDFKEDLVDKYDDTPGVIDSTKGVFLKPLPLPTFYDSGDLAIQYWISINNDRINMVLMGNPDVSYDDYLTSYCTIGKVDSFKDKLTDKVYSNDVVGNFAISVGSSTIPCVLPPDTEFPIDLTDNDIVGDIVNMFDEGEIGYDAAFGLNGQKANYSDTYSLTITSPANPAGKTGVIEAKKRRESYRFTFFNDQLESVASKLVSIYAYTGSLFKTTNGILEVADLAYDSYNVNTLTEDRIPTLDKTDETEFEMLLTMLVTIPAGDIQDNIRGMRIYKYAHDYGDSMKPTSTDPFYKVGEIIFTDDNKVAGEYSYTDPMPDVNVTIDDDKLCSPFGWRSDLVDFAGVIRDETTGGIISIVVPDTYGEGVTANGVSDVAVLMTRMGAFYQKHFVSFITPDEFMRKENFNPSKWTGRCHLSNIYICHGGDGYRGFLKDVVMVDNTNIINTDVLIVNEGSTDPANPEMRYKYFKITAPFSFINTAANYAYGIAVKMI